MTQGDNGDGGIPFGGTYRHRATRDCFTISTAHDTGWARPERGDICVAQRAARLQPCRLVNAKAGFGQNYFAALQNFFFFLYKLSESLPVVDCKLHQDRTFYGRSALLWRCSASFSLASSSVDPLGASFAPSSADLRPVSLDLKPGRTFLSTLPTPSKAFPVDHCLNYHKNTLDRRSVLLLKRCASTILLLSSVKIVGAGFEAIIEN